MMGNSSTVGSAKRAIGHALANFAEFHGRASRAEFLWLFGLYMAVRISLELIDTLIGAGPGWFIVVGECFVFLPVLATAARRLHDSNRSAHWLWLPLAPLLIIVVATLIAIDDDSPPKQLSVLCGLSAIGLTALIFVWLCQRGTYGDNRFGPDPLAEA